MLVLVVWSNGVRHLQYEQVAEKLSCLLADGRRSILGSVPNDAHCSQSQKLPKPAE